MKKMRLGIFGTVVLTFITAYAVVRWVIPWASQEITGLFEFPLSVPSALMFIYMTLTLVALFMFVTFSDNYLREFLKPIIKFLEGGYGRLPRLLVLSALPLIVGWQVWNIASPNVELPLSLRIQHPSSNFPIAFEDKHNPFAKPSDGDVEAFIEEAVADEVTFIPQVVADVKSWQRENRSAHGLGFLTMESVQQLIAEIEAGEVDRETAREALIEKNLFEGRALYAMNCRPCHGDSVSGDGPLADGFKLRPINFTDIGTIETIVEGYTFWRVSNGGQALPAEATPWDSAMPEWQQSLTEEERWKIILAEYDLAQKTPRIPEE